MTDVQVRWKDTYQVEHRPEISFQMSRLTTQLARIEAEARAARTDRLPAAGWAPFAIESGLTSAQETFISHWSPKNALLQCRAQRDLLTMLAHWLTTHHEEADLDNALAVLTTLSDALPDPPGPS